jgi:hypothetical protein
MEAVAGAWLAGVALLLVLTPPLIVLKVIARHRPELFSGRFGWMIWLALLLSFAMMWWPVVRALIV